MKFRIKNKKKALIADADKPEKENTPLPASISDKKNKRKFPEETTEKNDVESQSAKRSKKEKKKQPPIEENHADVKQSSEVISQNNDVPVPPTKKSKKRKKKQSTIEKSHVEEEHPAVAIPENSDAKLPNVKKSKKNKKNKVAIEENQPVEVVSENNDTESQSEKKHKKKKKKKNKAVIEDNEEEETPDIEAISKSNEIESLFVEKSSKKNTEATKKENGTEQEQGTESISKKEGKRGQKNDLFKKKPEKGDSTTGKKLRLPHQITAERESRTIFIGNLPVKFEKKKLQKLVGKFGEIESIRIRGAIPECDKISKRVAVYKKMFNKNQQSLNAYVVFKSVEDAQRALSLNGQIFEERHLRVTLPTEKVSDKNKGIFVGNLAYKITEEELWDFFKDCGEISSVRIIRDGNSGLCKGFGYVNFKSEDSVEFALKLNENKLQDREIRINRLFSEGKLEKLKKKKERNSVNNNKPDQKSNSKKEKFSNDRPGFNKKFKSKTEKNTDDKPGFKFKKKNLNKVDLKKKKLAEKLLAKSKKPVASS